MKKITAKFILENLDEMKYGKHIMYRGAEYWMQCDQSVDSDGVHYDTENGTIYYISEDRKILGDINGYEYAKVIGGVPYKI